MNLCEFEEFCKQNSIHFTIHFSEAEYLYEIWIESASEQEQYYEKKVSMKDLDGFCQRWIKHVKEEVAKLNWGKRGGIDE